MIRSRTKGLFNAYIFVLSVVLFVSFWVYFWLLTTTLEMEANPSRYFSYSLIALFGLLINLFRVDLATTNLLASDPLQAIRFSVRQVLYVGGAILFMLFLTKDQGISRLFLSTYLPLLWALLFAVNLLIPRWLCHVFFTGRHTTRTLLVGPPNRVRHLRRWLRVVQGYGVEVIGLVTEDAKRKSSYGIPVIGKPNELETIIRRENIHSVLLLEIPDDRHTVSKILDIVESTGARLVAVNSLSEAFMHSLRYFHHFGFDFVSLREEPLEDPVSRILKRLFDILISLPVVLFIIPPLALLVSLVHRCQSPGSLFYRQPRTGLRNEPFEILKFRTMHITDTDPSLQATANDPRIFPLAKFLRRSSIDEFPQFLNVLLGQMSLVGPRPHMVEHDQRFAAIFKSYHVRSFVKPGLTGLAQIRGFRGEARTDEDIRSRIECDIEYIERWSLVLDIFIVLKTAWQVVRPPRTAY